MSRKPYLWWLAIVLWVAALWSYAIGAENVPVNVGDLNFNFSQLIVLLALGVAWGDARRGNADMAKRLDHLEKRLDQLDRD